METRGLVELDGGGLCPHTTGGDAIAIASIFDHSVRANGTPGVLRRWRGLLADLDRDALVAQHATFPDNREFWATVEMAAVFLDDMALAPPAPAVWDALVDQIGAHAARNAGPAGKDPFGLTAATFDDLWTAQRDYFAQKRGFDVPEPPPGFGMKGMKIPRTTNADVIALSTWWSVQLATAPRASGYQTTVDKWKVAEADVQKYANTDKLGDVYPKNSELWRTLSDVSIQIAIGVEAPSKWDLAKDSIKDSVTHLPENLEHAASKGVDLLASAAHAVGKVANEAGKGLFSGFGTPLLIGAGLVGLFLISRGHHEES